MLPANAWTRRAMLIAMFADDRAYLRPIVIIAIQTGLRKGELLSLKRTQVDLVRELIHVTNTKSGRDKFVPMNVVVRSELRKAAEASSADSEYLFANPTSGKPYVDIKKGFRSACDDAKIGDLRFHDLRHTFGTRLADSGASTRTIMDLISTVKWRQAPGTLTRPTTVRGGQWKRSLGTRRRLRQNCDKNEKSRNRSGSQVLDCIGSGGRT